MSQDNKVGIGAYIALILAVMFFSGIFGMIDGPEALGLLDFSTLNGSFGAIENADGSTTFRGVEGTGARDGFMFGLSLLPTVIFALAIVEIAQHYGALDAARKLLTPLLKPLLGLPGAAGLTLIASLQSTDAGGAMTKSLSEAEEITQKQKSVFASFQFSAGATITNVFASGAILYGLTMSDGSMAITVPMIIPLAVIFIMKFVGANLMRLNLMRDKGDAEWEQNKKPTMAD
ncbi:nucleoside recognition domain-containing protein [Natranaerobius thermophilus]|uniref:Nucleoside recognition domain protein n=1 Tax=Natranaerobius thermophilus (strain ATCC BAA-1301 / DSM 18059 / JW/NM-WN-LF) TaxID=457570 RepID=B2A7R3_NATTJ|nr:nucleoside recognition domain-containing protein [Natranaerobius thermophilus]ACB84365.1 nucleoside recognition domain protein [Natranaerobius thermophilus JW/NM-WN-LF]